MGFSTRTPPDTDATEKRTIGRGLFRLCEGCSVTLPEERFSANWEVCPECGHHFPMSAERWIQLLIDDGTFEEKDPDLVSVDPLGFVDSQSYGIRTAAAQKKTGLKDAFISGSGSLESFQVELGVFAFRYMGGSMGSVVGEKITRVFERATERQCPAIVLSASGGARMHEGILSLMQMAKTVSALGRLRETKQPFISILLHPTTGGVAASFALLGDVNIAEPRALVGFAGPRVIETTIRQSLPEGFQRSEFLLEHGMVDHISSRFNMKRTVGMILGHLGRR